MIPSSLFPVNSMRSLLLSAMLSLLLSSALVMAQTSSIEADRVVAVVNDEAITLSELKARVANVERQLKGQNTPLPAQDVLTRQILERLIVDRAQAQLARESGIAISDAELDAALRRIADANRFSLQEFRTRLEKDGIRWNRFREEVREEITLSRLREREVDSRVTVTDGEVDNYLANTAANGDADV